MIKRLRGAEDAACLVEHDLRTGRGASLLEAALVAFRGALNALEPGERISAVAGISPQEVIEAQGARGRGAEERRQEIFSRIALNLRAMRARVETGASIAQRKPSADIIRLRKTV